MVVGDGYSTGTQVVYNSGTWGINISGNATTATTSTYAQYLWSTSHPGSYYIYNYWTGSQWRVTSNHSDTVSVSYSDTAGNANNFAGYNNSNYLNHAGTSYYEASTWIHWPSTGAGLYWSASGVGTGGSGYAEIFATTTETTYGLLRVSGYRNSYSGICMGDSNNVVVGMYDTSGNGGNWDPSTGWHFYWHGGNTCLGIGGSSTAGWI